MTARSFPIFVSLGAFLLCEMCHATAPFLDTSYGVGGAARVAFDLGGDDYDVPTALAKTSDGKILVAGTASTTSGLAAVIAKLGVDGVLDPTFGANHDGRAVLPFDGQIGSLSEFSDHTIVYAGTVGSTAVVGRLTPAGLVDTSFNTTGYHLVAGTAFSDSGNGAGFFKVSNGPAVCRRR